MTAPAGAPRSDLELYSDEALTDPYPRYRALRDAGAAVWLTAYDMFVLARFEDVRDALANWQVFSSAHGVTLNDQMNEALRNGLLCSDSPRHDVLRKIIERPLTPRALSELRERITTEAEKHVERLVARGSFDAATDLAHHLPVTIVSELVGLPDEGRERMLDWAPANFDCFGPMNDRTRTAFKIVGEMVEYAFTQCVPGKLKPGGWAAMIWEAADRGEIAAETCPFLMNDYMGPSLDTTIFATANAIWLFAQHPDQWDLIRANPALIPQAINEIVRIETPIQGFSRYVAQDTSVDGIALPQGSRAIVLYASANRDERKWGDPDNFNIMRNATAEHLAFGFGEHVCVGNHLARLEMRALLAALAKRVKRFELGATERCLNNVLRGLSKCEVTVH
jgi:cytochrome P450